MGLVSVGLFLLLSFSAHIGAGYGLSVQDPVFEWERMSEMIEEEETPEALEPRASSGSSTPKAKRVPEFQIIQGSSDVTKYLKPGGGYRKLPHDVREMLLVTAAPKVTTARPSGSGKPTTINQPPVEILCHVDRLYVRVLRRLFQYRDDFKYLKLGKCPVNQATADHYYLLYLLKTDCGWKRESLPDAWSVSIVLRYERPKHKCIMRQLNFEVPLNCQYYRFFHSYKVGFLPKLRGGTLFKALTPKTSSVLTSEDASGNKLANGKTYTLGEPMYFSASRPDAGKLTNKRMYIHKCFMTVSKNPNSNPKFTVIDNYGCMLDSKLSPNSKFLPCKSKLIQKFMVSAFVFRDKLSRSSRTQQLYLHCNMELGPLTPTKTSKACSFDDSSKKWKELYGPDSVCTCCEKPYTCSSSTKPRATTDMVSSPSWKVDLSDMEEEEPEESVPQVKSTKTEMIVVEEPNVPVDEDMEDIMETYWEDDEY